MAPKISEFREKMDRTLACQDLINEESIKKLVKRQFSLSPMDETNDYVLERRTKEVKNFLDMMRSASGDNHNKMYSDWKVKEDNDEYRVMYREGPQGTPFHVLLVEAYADAPMDVCLCAAWETVLYKKWWPQITIPTFKITADGCLQKIRLGEHLSFIRMKVTWPLSAREVIIHYFELEYLEEDLIIGLLTSVPDIDNVKKDTHGFSNEGIPKAKDIVRMDFVGGTAMKRLSQNKTYYRTIGSMDIKLDFVPTWLINFMARQLVGGACKLYQKTVAAVAKGDKDFVEALKDPLYVRIREGLNSRKNLKNGSELKAIETGQSAIVSEQYAIEEEEEQVEQELNAKGKKEEEIEPESFLGRNEKTVVSVAEGDKDFEEALKDPLYVRIREGLDTEKNLKKNSELKAIESGKSTILSEQYAIEEEEEIEPDSDSERNDEEEMEPGSSLERNEKVMDHSSTAKAIEHCHSNGSNENKVTISSEVQEALGMLDNAIDMVQRGEFGNQTLFGFGSINQDALNSEPIVTKVGLISYASDSLDNISKGLDEANNDSNAHYSSSRFAKPTNLSRETQRKRIAPALPLQDTVILTNNQEGALTPSQDYEEIGVEVNVTNEGGVNSGREKLGQKKNWKCSCFSPSHT